MEPVEKIIDNATNPLTIEIDLPEAYWNKRLKVTVTPLEEKKTSLKNTISQI
jgi:hypothetical protein